ncbi:hypothetical protein BDZ97DRAFT_1924181 [Flammula alnicola]|nr:hypothetical protein BDZ97DRAFT_1924181 [Flammula alnicola]
MASLRAGHWDSWRQRWVAEMWYPSSGSRAAAAPTSPSSWCTSSSNRTAATVALTSACSYAAATSSSWSHPMTGCHTADSGVGRRRQWVLASAMDASKGVAVSGNEGEDVLGNVSETLETSTKTWEYSRSEFASQSARARQTPNNRSTSFLVVGPCLQPPPPHSVTSPLSIPAPKSSKSPLLHEQPNDPASHAPPLL